MSQSTWRDQTLFREWRWTHPDAQVMAQARLRMQEIKAEVWGKKTALDWETYTEIPQGFAVHWNGGATKKVAHHWFWQRLFPEARVWKKRVHGQVSQVWSVSSVSWLFPRMSFLCRLGAWRDPPSTF